MPQTETIVRRGGRVIPADLGHHVRSSEVDSFKQGDRVRVRDDKAPTQTYEFVWYVTNVMSGRQWCELWGGPPKNQSWVVCDLSRLTKVDRRR